MNFEELKQSFLPRFWDSVDSVMTYPTMVNIGNNFQIISYNLLFGNLTIEQMLFNDRFIMMKPTGTTDNNHKVVYDGDICTDITDDIFIVVWDKEDAAFKLLEDDNVLHEFDNDVYVIGNIHENPELMEQNNDR